MRSVYEKEPKTASREDSNCIGLVFFIFLIFVLDFKKGGGNIEETWLLRQNLKSYENNMDNA